MRKDANPTLPGMPTQDLLDKSNLPAHEMWWLLLQARLSQVAVALPKELRGVVQFEVELDNQEPVYFHLDVRSSGTVGKDGVAEVVDAFVTTTESEVKDVLFAPEPPPGALRVCGNVGLFRSLLNFMAETPQSTSWLGVRAL